MEYLTVCLAVLLASGLTLFSGFGLGTILTPVFALFFPVTTAVAMTAIVHLANNLFKIGLVGRDADWRVVARFGLPAALAAIRDLGFAGIEVLAFAGARHSIGDLPGAWLDDEATCASLRRQLSGFGYTSIATHAPFIDLAVFTHNPGIRAESLRQIRAAIAGTACIGGTVDSTSSASASPAGVSTSVTPACFARARIASPAAASQASAVAPRSTRPRANAPPRWP